MDRDLYWNKKNVCIVRVQTLTVIPIFICTVLYQGHSEGAALTHHVARPDAGLYLTEVCLVKKHHTKTALSDAAAHAEWQFACKEFLVKIEFLAVLLPRDGKLSEEALLINADAHRREFYSTVEHRIP